MPLGRWRIPGSGQIKSVTLQSKPRTQFENRNLRKPNCCSTSLEFSYALAVAEVFHEFPLRCSWSSGIRFRAPDPSDLDSVAGRGCPRSTAGHATTQQLLP